MGADDDVKQRRRSALGAAWKSGRLKKAIAKDVARINAEFEEKKREFEPTPERMKMVIGA